MYRLYEIFQRWFVILKSGLKPNRSIEKVIIANINGAYMYKFIFVGNTFW